MTYHPNDSDDDGTVEAEIDTTSVSTDEANIDSLGTLNIQNGSDLASSRSLDTTYENTTGYTFSWIVTLEAASGAEINAQAVLAQSSTGAENGSNRLDFIKLAPDSSNNQRCTLRGIVPPGYYYRVRSFGGEVIDRWHERELRQ